MGIKRLRDVDARLVSGCVEVPSIAHTVALATSFVVQLLGAVRPQIKNGEDVALCISLSAFGLDRIVVESECDLCSVPSDPAAGSRASPWLAGAHSAITRASDFCECVSLHLAIPSGLRDWAEVAFQAPDCPTFHCEVSRAESPRATIRVSISGLFRNLPVRHAFYSRSPQRLHHQLRMVCDYTAAVTLLLPHARVQLTHNGICVLLVTAPDNESAQAADSDACIRRIAQLNPQTDVFCAQSDAVLLLVAHVKQSSTPPPHDCSNRKGGAPKKRVTCLLHSADDLGAQVASCAAVNQWFDESTWRSLPSLASVNVVWRVTNHECCRICACEGDCLTTEFIAPDEGALQKALLACQASILQQRCIAPPSCDTVVGVAMGFEFHVEFEPQGNSDREGTKAAMRIGLFARPMHGPVSERRFIATIPSGDDSLK